MLQFCFLAAAGAIMTSLEGVQADLKFPPVCSEAHSTSSIRCRLVLVRVHWVLISRRFRRAWFQKHEALTPGSFVQVDKEKAHISSFCARV